VQDRLPEVGRKTVDEDYFCPLTLADAIAEARGEFQSRGATADDDDSMGRVNLLLRVMIQHDGSPGSN
jgi:hypothetical protein